ncbi:hypothetical protein [Mesobacillus campisalis]|uniref:hypothetical protein n=1 Tax=Mesobacillus campisalis TaxID=1408103 RepID=UPI000A5E438C|nr:hypothetical protein [Mesobacillus campisalis]
MIELKGNDDIKGFLEIFGHFHDSCLKELLMWTDSYVDDDPSMKVGVGLDTKIRMLFQRQSNVPAAIELLFEGVTHFQLKPSPENYDSIIYDANLLLKDETFYWTDSVDWTPNDHNEEITWISAKKVKWREVNHWIGEERRYKTVEE